MSAKRAFTSGGQSSVREGREGPSGERRRYAPRMAPAERREQLIDAALEVILEQGYGGVSIEAIARRAGVTRPVVYDHFPNLGRLLHSLVEREERISLEQLEQVVPGDPGDRDPIEVLAGGVRRFLEAVASRPATWRIILLPLEGTPQVVRDHVETNRARTQERIANIVRWALERPELPDDLDVELTARAIRVLSEDAGRTLLTDPEGYPPERYEVFVRQVLALVLPSGS
jgi:AcrR family transcriptional regulator